MTTTELRGRICLVTGATSGIGLETARDLTRRGATVLLVARDQGRGEAAARAIRQEAPAGTVVPLVADLASLVAVRRLAETIRARHGRLDVLINNAGVALSARRLTADGLEATFATNYLAPFLLTNLLLDLLRGGGPARIVNVASDTHRGVRAIPWDDLQGARAYRGHAAYDLSKLLLILFTRQLAERLADTTVTANALHPGWPLRTRLDRDARGAFRLFSAASKLFAPPVAHGARTSLYLATAPEVATVSGRYFTDCRAVAPSPLARDDDAAARLWRESAALCQR
jgi:retinol dehydrogenase-12